MQMLGWRICSFAFRAMHLDFARRGPPTPRVVLPAEKDKPSGIPLCPKRRWASWPSAQWRVSAVQGHQGSLTLAGLAFASVRLRDRCRRCYRKPQAPDGALELGESSAQPVAWSSLQVLLASTGMVVLLGTLTAQPGSLLTDLDASVHELTSSALSPEGHKFYAGLSNSLDDVAQLSAWLMSAITAAALLQDAGPWLRMVLHLEEACVWRLSLSGCNTGPYLLLPIIIWVPWLVFRIII